MSEPTELSPAARALLAEARGGDDPSDQDRARGRRTLMAAIAGGASVAATSAASSAAASATAAGSTTVAATGMSLTLKIAAVVLVVGAVSGTVAVAPWEPDPPVAAPEVAAELRGAAPRGPARAAAPVASAEVSPTPAEMAVDPAPLAPSEAGPGQNGPSETGPGQNRPSETGPSEAAPSEPLAAPAPRAQRRAAARATPPQQLAASPPAPVEAPQPAAPSSPSTLAEEMRLLRSAQSALSAGDPETALARLAEHARRFPAGTLAEEREAARILALCRAERRGEARAAAARFLRERPTSPLAPRVRASCE